MRKKILLLLIAFVSLVIVGGLSWADAQSRKPVVQMFQGEKPIKPQECYRCHDVIKELHVSGKHARVNCVGCHSGLAQHLTSPNADTRPITNVSWEACGYRFRQGTYQGKDAEGRILVDLAYR